MRNDTGATPELSRVCESAFLVRTPAPHAAFYAIQALRHPGIVNLHPAYESVLVEFDPVSTEADELARVLSACLARSVSWRAADAKTVEIPVVYDGEDLAEVAGLHGMTPAEVAHAHYSAHYTVAFLGFQPGFAYLSGLPERLETPRLATPRLKVPAGSVGIAGRQTGVYPAASPGGWRLIGRTTLVVFDPSREAPSLLLPGDTVRFVPVTREGAC